ncbi:flagellar biosynthesis anti-sigma factor FlgM [Granulosicoccus antarcticus]|uniref:Anti-sigma-28 factor FlgM C-terminal domain-containing protein n=1 Tax=Granulosicoccus antarcticus IMCC3135 TaxID=1192854 RepID=A0A2Z2NYY1_9GAMM|nr:flagellar biosynthesis anti-sigma factor FlgM [Granulosicoccus antarcticus]ASJ75645.1 hypothetical protein IMCC3135_27965 [Granulosicoccus antarcticus IMCC3135]
MALSKSGKSSSNVSKLDDARKKRSKSGPSTKSTAAQKEEEPPQLADTEVKKPVAKAKTSSKPKVSNRRFDTVKVERLKSEIASGTYQINFLNVADKFIEHERYA